MKTLGYYNGVFGELDKMTVPMLDRAYYFGDGIYDAAYCRNYKIYALREHVARFFAGAAALGLHLPYTEQQTEYLLQELARHLDEGDSFVYWQASRGSALREHVPPRDLQANVSVMIVPRKIKPRDTVYRLRSAEDKRHFLCQYKSLSLLAGVLAAEQAASAGGDEALLYRLMPDGRKRITECAHSNVCALIDGALVCPPADRLILAGVARQHLMDACREIGVPVREEVLWMEDLLVAQEVLTTASGALCARVCEIDGIAVGGKADALTRQLQTMLYDAYEQATQA